MNFPNLSWGALGLIVACADTASQESPSTSTQPLELEVMSFNIWRSGGLGLDETVNAIRTSAADIVGLQECNAETAGTIARELGVNEVHDDNGHVILSRFPVARIGSTRDPWGGLGATVTLSAGRRVHVFDAHLDYDEYGPYALQEGASAEAILERENARRMPGLVELFQLMAPFLGSAETTFLVGDFNAPSHLDYADFAWPESLACYARGLADSYREAHPENRTYPGAFAFDEPGITWTPITSEEVRGAFDRIDFVYYTPSRGIVPTRSVELDGRNSVRPWPSDHRAVMTTFSVAAHADDT